MRPLLLLMLAGTVCAADPKPLPLRKRLAAAMKTVRSFRADFEQEKKLKVFKKPVRSSGVLLFERPDRMRWETRTPFRSLLVVNGAKVAKFEWVDGKRRALKLGRGADALLVAVRRLRAWFSGEFDEKTFSVEVKEKPAIRLILRPKEKALRGRPLEPQRSGQLRRRPLQVPSRDRCSLFTNRLGVGSPISQLPGHRAHTTQTGSKSYTAGGHTDRLKRPSVSG